MSMSKEELLEVIENLAPKQLELVSEYIEKVITENVVWTKIDEVDKSIPHSIVMDEKELNANFNRMISKLRKEAEEANRGD